jgi:hypothetical protein
MENPCTAKEPKLKGSNILPGSSIGLAYQGQDIVFRFIIEYSSLSDFRP